MLLYIGPSRNMLQVTGWRSHGDRSMHTKVQGWLEQVEGQQVFSHESHVLNKELICVITFINKARPRTNLSSLRNLFF